MTRVEWTRYEGNDVEAVVAMLVNLENVDSVRITPSSGDGGVDILDRGAGPDGTDVVYQVKRYTGPLDSKQQGNVEHSLHTLFQDPRWAQLNVKLWRLVTPWDPTPRHTRG
ncbi:restriction endonuclease [Yinghuangia aomiensis]